MKIKNKNLFLFMAFIVNLFSQNVFATPIIDDIISNPNPVESGSIVDFSVIAHDTSELIVLYQVDWDNDGTYDESNTLDGNFSYSFFTPSPPQDWPVSFKVDNTIGEYDIEIINIHVVAKGSITPAPIPEPTTMLLLGAGLIGLAATRRKMKRQ